MFYIRNSIDVPNRKNTIGTWNYSQGLVPYVNLLSFNRSQRKDSIDLIQTTHGLGWINIQNKAIFTIVKW